MKNRVRNPEHVQTRDAADWWLAGPLELWFTLLNYLPRLDETPRGAERVGWRLQMEWKFSAWATEQPNLPPGGQDQKKPATFDPLTGLWSALMAALRCRMNCLLQDSIGGQTDRRRECPVRTVWWWVSSSRGSAHQQWHFFTLTSQNQCAEICYPQH